MKRHSLKYIFVYLVSNSSSFLAISNAELIISCASGTGCSCSVRCTSGTNCVEAPCIIDNLPNVYDCLDFAEDKCGSYRLAKQKVIISD